MRLGLTGDQHFQKNNMVEHSRGWKWILSDMADKKVHWVALTGDVFQTGLIADGDAAPQDITRAFLEPVEEVGLPILIDEGNHDLGALKNRSALDIFAGHPLIRTVTTLPKTVFLHGPHDHVAVTCLPWVAPGRWPAEARPRGWQDVLEVVRGVMIPEYDPLGGDPQHNCQRILLGHINVDRALLFNDQRLADKVIDRDPFMFPAEELEALRFDAIFLGHVHRRQDLSRQLTSFGIPFLYCGSMMRLNHGEHQQQDGWHLYDTETRQTIFHPYNEGPKYWNISRTEYALYKDMIDLSRDQVRFTDGEIPVELVGLDRVSRKTPKKAGANVRELGAGLTGDLRELVSRWAEETSTIIPTRPEFWQKLEVLATNKVNSNGALQALRSVHLTGIGPHLNRRVYFNEGWTVLLGENETGKTFLLEAILGALYGRWATQGRTVKGSCLGPDSSITAEFELADGVYSVMRHPMKPSVKVQKHGASKAEAEGDAPVRRWVETHLGDFEAFTRACFLEQHPSQDMLMATPSQRMAMMRDFLGISHFDEYAKTMEKKASGFAGALKRMTSAQDTKQETWAAIVADQTEDQQLEAEIQQLTQMLESPDVMSAAQQHAAISQKVQGLQQQITHDTARQTELRLSVQRLRSEIERGEALVLSYEARVNQALRQAQVCQQLVTMQGQMAERGEKERTLKLHLQMAEPLQRAGCASQGYLPCGLIDQAKTSASEVQVLQGILAQLPSVDENLYKQLQAELNTLQPVTQDVLDQQRATVTRQREEWQRANTELFQLEGRQRENHQALTNAQEALQQLSAQTTNLQQERQRRVNRQQYVRGQLETHQRTIQRLDREIADAGRDGIEEHEWRVLATAFGKTGIPQFLISEALPGLQGYLDEMTSEYFDDQFQLILDTQKETTTAGIQENFVILYRCGNVEHDAKGCSGGRLATVRALWKLALLQWQDRNAGYRVLFLDEPSAHASTKNTDLIMDMLRQQQHERSLNQIIIVTHSQRLAAQVDNRIEL